MTIKIVSQEKKSTGDNVYLTLEQVQSLVDNYYDRMKKKKGSLSRQLNKSEDSKSAWFAKEKLDELFANNGCRPDNNGLYGLRIYFGVHKEHLIVDNQNRELIKDSYFNQQTVILVATRDENGVPDHDCLKENNVIEIAALLEGQNDGLDNGKLCPPEQCSGSVITFPG